MKNTKLLPLFFLFVCMLFAGNQVSASEGITFFQGSWEELLQEAKKQNKPIFVDAYATWCGPCKYMDKSVFTLPDVATYYNTEFLSYRLDVDAESALAQEFEITAMPTYLFTDAEGNVFYRITGAMEGPEFIQVGKNALAIPSLEEKFATGDRSPDFIKKYLLAHKEDEAEEYRALATEYFKNVQPGALKEEDNFVLMAHYMSDIKAHPVNHFLANFDTYSAINEQLAQEFANNLLLSNFNQAIDNRDMSYLKNMEYVIGQVKSLFTGVNPEMMSSAFYLKYYEHIEDWPTYAQKTVEHFEKYGREDDEWLYSAGFQFYQNVEDKPALEKMAGWMWDEIQAEPGYANQFLYAGILSKLDQKDKALTHARLAMELAEQDGEVDTSIIQDLINSLQ